MKLPQRRTIHVYPMGSKRKHETGGRMCWCDPKVHREVKRGARNVRAFYIVAHFRDPAHRHAA